MELTYILLISFLIISLILSFLKNSSLEPQKPTSHPNNPSPNYVLTTFTQPIDHTQSSSPTWSQRIITDSTYWSGAQNLGPLLFLTGCEADLVDIYNGNGYFNRVIIPQVGAYAIYAEHRYYGQSLPFGADSWKRENLKYLSSEQTLEDFAAVIEYYKTKVLNCPDCPVITYGGSYCGELASWMRMEHPELVDGAVASSAPIRGFESVVDPEAYYIKSTLVYNQTGKADVIKEGFVRLKAYSAASSSYYQQLNQYMNFCSPLTNHNDVLTLLYWLRNSYIMGSMLNLVQTSGAEAGKRLVDTAMKAFDGLTVKSSDQDIFIAMRNSGMISMRYDPSKCLGVLGKQKASEGYQATQADAFDILTCNDLVESVGNNGVDDMYYPGYPWSKAGRLAYCTAYYGLVPKFDWPLNTFGGWQLSDYAKYSNIFFANNKNDPWFPFSVTQNVSDSVVAYTVEDGCHGQDLFYPNIYDSDSLKFVRAKELEFVEKWIREKQNKVKRVISQ